MLPADLLLDLLPFDAEGRVGQHVVKGPARMAVLRQGIAEGDVGNILTLDQHVSLTDGVGFRVQLLARHGQLGGGVEFLQVLFGHRQHAARSSGGVIDGAHHARLGKDVVVLHEQQVDHQPDDFARGKVFPGGFVGEFSKLTDQLFEDGAHLAG